MRWILRLFGILLSVLVVVVAALFLLPAERLAGMATQQFEARTGRSLEINGAVRPSIWPTLGARVEGVRLAAPDWAEGGPLLEAETLDLGVDLAALWRGDLVMRRFEAVGARLTLERAADGRANWTFEGLGTGSGASSAATTEPANAGGSLSLERITIRDADLRYIDRASGLDLRFSGVSGELAMPDLNGPGTMSVALTYNGQPLELQANIGVVASFLAGEISTLGVSGTAAGSRFGFEGRAGLSPAVAEGRLTFEAPALAPLLALAGQSGAEPLPAALRPLGFTGQVTRAPSGSLHLRESTLSAGSLRAALALDITLGGERPRISGQIDAGALDLTPFMGGSEGGGAASNGSSGWSTSPIDASALGSVDTDLAITAAPLRSGVVDLERFSGQLAIDRARAVLTLREARGFGGNLTGELVANNRNGLSVGGNLQARDVRLIELLGELADFRRLNGSGAVDLRFLGVGQSMDAIMRSLSGEGVVRLGEGEILGLDLWGMLRNMDLSYMGEGQRTIYESLGASFTIQNGVLSNSDLALASGRYSVAGRGTVNLGARTLDYRITPTALTNSATGETIRVPLIISGPWAEPRFRLDLEGLAEQRLQEERARLEQRGREEAARLEAEARERLAREAQERLGIQLQEGQSTTEQLEDGLRQRAADELRGGLQRLLGGN